MNEKTKRILELRSEGKLYHEISEELNCTVKSVARVCENYGYTYKTIPKHLKHTETTKPKKYRVHDKEILDLYEQGFDYQSICKMVDIKRDTLRLICNRLGIDTSKKVIATEIDILNKYEELKDVKAVADFFGYKGLTRINKVLIKNGLRVENLLKHKLETITDLREQGKTYREIAEELGMTKDQVERFCQREGLGYSDEEKFRAMSENRKGKAPSNKGIYSDWSKKIKEKTNGRFEFVERISIKDSDEAELRIRCLICGTEKTVVSSMLRGTNAHRIRCSACFVEGNRKAREERREQERIEKEFARLRKRQESGHQMSMKFCPDCGQLVDYRSKYCKEHREEHKKEMLRILWKNNEYKRQSRLNGKLVDKDIEIHKLAKRDGDVCWLCGQLVDWDDYEIRDGQKQSGNYYPSIDHVIPVALGGEHSWDNVKLAHRICNSYKGAKPLSMPLV